MGKKRDKMGLTKQSLKQLGYEVIEIEKLVKADWNYKGEDEGKSIKLQENIKRNGQIENIIVRKLETGFYEVVNGNHRYDAMKEIGFKFAVVHNKGEITLSEAKRIAIETNETKFDTDQLKLAELLGDINAEFSIDEMAVTMPYNPEEIKDMVDVLGFDFTQFHEEPKNGFAQPTEGSDEKYQTISVDVPEETANLWNKWQERCKELLGYDNPSKAFEFAIIEAINLPDEAMPTDPLGDEE